MADIEKAEVKAYADRQSQENISLGVSVAVKGFDPDTERQALNLALPGEMFDNRCVAYLQELLVEFLIVYKEGNQAAIQELQNRVSREVGIIEEQLQSDGYYQLALALLCLEEKALQIVAGGGDYDLGETARKLYQQAGALIQGNITEEITVTP